MSAPAVQLAAVHFRFSRHARVLRGVDLAVAPGEIVRLGGANGSGKTTLLRVVVGVLRPTSGVRRCTASVGYVPQRGDDPPPGISVDAWLRVATLRRSRRALGAAHALLDELAGPQASAQLSTLSRGTVTKVLLAGALAGEPGLVVLDEPLAALDGASRSTATKLIHAAAANGTAILIAEHAGADAIGATRSFLMRDGQATGWERLSSGSASWRVVLRDRDGKDTEHVAADDERDAMLLAALQRGDEVRLVQPLQ